MEPQFFIVSTCVEAEVYASTPDSAVEQLRDVLREAGGENGLAFIKYDEGYSVKLKGSL
jgi:hypothetical protein